MAKKEIKAVQRLIKLEADASGNVEVPDRIHLLSSGHWHTPWHGAFEMTPADLADMIVHFEGGIGSVEGSKKLPINFGHDISGKAAGWITSLALENNGTELWGDIEWTPYGRQMLADAEFRYISPEWNPRDWPYENPEVEGEYFENVLTGAGLTNIPLFKKLTPIMASVDAGEGDKSKQAKGGDSMALTLDEIRGKKKEELSDEETAFLEEHKTELTDDERTTFGLTVDEGGEGEGAGEGGESEDEGEGASKQASAGQVSINASELAKLQAAAAKGVEASNELRKTRLAASIDAAVSRGAIKSDFRDKTVEMMMASSTKQEASVLEFIANLPDNKILASEIGSAASGDQSAEDELMTRAAAIVKDTAGRTKFADAMAGLMSSDSVLRDRVNAERASKN